MAGFVVLFESDSTYQAREDEFLSLVKQTIHFKQLEEPTEIIEGRFCTAAKLDALSSLHRGIIRDEHSGSWLLATGTVVALKGSNDPHLLLENLLIDYINNGISALERVDGHFALVIYNAINNSLTIVSDPMGIFAIYYAKIGTKVLVSTSALAIAKQIGANADELTIQFFLRTGRPYGENTHWQNVKRVLPAKVIQITPGKFEEQEYWKFFINEDISHLQMKEALALADENISRVFKIAFLREGKLWADLTGGYDTRMTTLYLEKLHIPFTTYCVGPEGHPDVEVSRMIAQEMGWEYRHLALPKSWAEDQIFWSCIALGRGDGLLNIYDLAQTLKFAQERSQSYVASVTGIGFDEWRVHQFGTNIVFPSAITSVDYDYILESDDLNVARIPLSAMSQDHSVKIREMVKDHLAGSIMDYPNINKVSQTDIAWHRYRHPIHVGAFTSAFSGNIRSITPFCFKELVNFGLSINHLWRIKYDMRFMRNLMERGNSRLANLPTEDGTPAIPIRFNTMHKFTPKFIHLADRFLQKTSQKVIGKRLSLQEQRHYPAYPQPEWVIARLRWAESENFFNPREMRTAPLYNQKGLADLVFQGLSGSSKEREFLEWVITVESALRATGASVN